MSWRRGWCSRRALRCCRRRRNGWSYRWRRGCCGGRCCRLRGCRSLRRTGIDGAPCGCGVGVVAKIGIDERGPPRNRMEGILPTPAVYSLSNNQPIPDWGHTIHGEVQLHIVCGRAVVGERIIIYRAAAAVLCGANRNVGIYFVLYRFIARVSVRSTDDSTH